MNDREKIEIYKQTLAAPANGLFYQERFKKRRRTEPQLRRELTRAAVSAGLISPLLVLLITLVKPLLWAAIVELAKEVIEKLQEFINEQT